MEDFSLRNYVIGWASQVALVVKNMPASAGGIRDGGLIRPLEEGMATHSSILAWRISWTEEPGGLQSMGLQRLGTTDVTACMHNLFSKWFLGLTK